MANKKNNPFSVLKGFSVKAPEPEISEKSLESSKTAEDAINNEEDFALFKQETSGIKKLSQDTIIPPPKTISNSTMNFSANNKSANGKSANRQSTNKSLSKEQQRTLHETQINEFYFSDEYVPLLQEGATRYLREDVPTHELKRLRRGDYVPDVFLDLHGMTQANAKRELAALITFCINENVSCASVMHGIGKHILKERVPAWLAQHPKVMAFHQAPLEFGGQSALLVLLSIPD